MPSRLHRNQETGNLHFITFTCYHRRRYLDDPNTRDLFEEMLEQSRRLYRFWINAYVVMPEHVHLLLSEPERSVLSVALQALKQSVSRRQRIVAPPFWQARYYDRNIWSHEEFEEKLHYIHMNAVRRGLATRPEDWAWSSFGHIATGAKRVVEVESQWTARERERAGFQVKFRFAAPHPSKTG